MTKRKNLISKRTGVGDHMSYDWVTKKWLPNANPYIDVVGINKDTGEEELGNCIKNQYKEVDWVKNIIRAPYWQSVGKKKSLYQYFVDSKDIRKPNEKNGYTEDELYKLASGDMQFDFDDLNDELINDLKNAFNECCHNPCYNWFEYSWSGHGCHIRVYVKLKLYTKLEWGFWYIHLLNGILLHTKNTEEIIKHIDWSCATITRGFAIPYNEGGVIENPNYDENKIVIINNEDELDNIFQNVSYKWYDELYDRFIKKFVTPDKKKKLQQMGLINDNGQWKFTYSMEQAWEFDESHPIVSGEIYNYNWRLSLVTTLMGVFNKDIEIVRDICKVIYRYIEPYKNHTYEEMIGNEFEYKILKRANFELEPNHAILKELWDDWGLKITIRRRIL